MDLMIFPGFRRGISRLPFVSFGIIANFGNTADKSMPLQKQVHFLRQFSPNSFGGRNLVNSCLA